MSSPHDDASRSRVLLVEDDLGTRLAVARYLRAQHLDVVAVESGRDALSELDGEPFDLLVLDLHLPDVGEHVVYDAAHASAPDMPVMVITGEESTSLPPVQLTLRKPFALADLHRSAERLIAQAPARRAC